jgi:hypothetical protein
MSTYYDELGYQETKMGTVDAKNNSKVIKFVTPVGSKLDGFKIVDILDINAENPIIEVIGHSGRHVRLRVPRYISVWYPSEGLSSSRNKLVHNEIVLDEFLTKNDKDMFGRDTRERMYQKFKDGKYNMFTYNDITTKDTASDGVFISYGNVYAMFAVPSKLLEQNDKNIRSRVVPRYPPLKWDEQIQEILTSEEEQAKPDTSGHGQSGGKRRSKSNNKKPKKTAKRSKRSKRAKSRRTRRQRK